MRPSLAWTTHEPNGLANQQVQTVQKGHKREKCSEYCEESSRIPKKDLGEQWVRPVYMLLQLSKASGPESSEEHGSDILPNRSPRGFPKPLAGLRVWTLKQLID
jgi:hypothetical protein